MLAIRSVAQVLQQGAESVIFTVNIANDVKRATGQGLDQAHEIPDEGHCCDSTSCF
jgi:hypothetical protein